jgi:hypothetical protein
VVNVLQAPEKPVNRLKILKSNEQMAYKFKEQKTFYRILYVFYFFIIQNSTINDKI